eukprot:scaffold58481_cov31-Tisochrysis_lutea.AAC.4
MKAKICVSKSSNASGRSDGDLMEEQRRTAWRIALSQDEATRWRCASARPQNNRIGVHRCSHASGHKRTVPCAPIGGRYPQWRSARGRQSAPRAANTGRATKRGKSDRLKRYEEARRAKGLDLGFPSLLERGNVGARHRTCVVARPREFG